ncbi:histone H1-like [Pimephales promelas]|nr:histone H1-like [Pimephales promelas]
MVLISRLNPALSCWINCSCSRGCSGQSPKEEGSKGEKAWSKRGGYDVEKNNSRVKIALKSLVKKGALVQTKGTGASGSFKAAKPKKAAVKKPAPKKSPKKVKKPAAAKKATKSPKKVKKPA